MSYVLQTAESTSGTREHVFFAGDEVQLAGQIDYPVLPLPVTGYPLIFVIQHATCNSRNGYAHITRLGNEMGMAVFRWDKRGTGKSGSGGGSSTLDAVQAYKAAVHQPHINADYAVILAQNEGSLILQEAWTVFRQINVPCGVVLSGNMLDEKAITTLDVPVTVVSSKNDWNAWQIYARDASAAHSRRYPQWPPSYYVATNSNRRLLYEHGGAFHRGASQHIHDWLKVTCPHFT